MTRHLPHPHLAGPFIHAFGEGIFAGLLHREHWHEPPARITPPAPDWPWRWEDQ